MDPNLVKDVFQVFKDPSIARVFMSQFDYSDIAPALEIAAMFNREISDNLLLSVLCFDIVGPQSPPKTASGIARVPPGFIIMATRAKVNLKCKTRPKAQNTHPIRMPRDCAHDRLIEGMRFMNLAEWYALRTGWRIISHMECPTVPEERIGELLKGGFNVAVDPKTSITPIIPRSVLGPIASYDHDMTVWLRVENVAAYSQMHTATLVIRVPTDEAVRKCLDDLNARLASASTSVSDDGCIRLDVYHRSHVGGDSVRISTLIVVMPTPGDAVSSYSWISAPSSIWKKDAPFFAGPQQITYLR